MEKMIIDGELVDVLTHEEYLSSLPKFNHEEIVKMMETKYYKYNLDFCNQIIYGMAASDHQVEIIEDTKEKTFAITTTYQDIDKVFTIQHYIKNDEYRITEEEYKDVVKRMNDHNVTSAKSKRKQTFKDKITMWLTKTDKDKKIEALESHIVVLEMTIKNLRNIKRSLIDREDFTVPITTKQCAIEFANYLRLNYPVIQENDNTFNTLWKSGNDDIQTAYLFDAYKENRIKVMG